MNALHSLSEDDLDVPPHGGYDFVMERNGYHVRLADSFEHRSKASLLVEQLYSNRGYETRDVVDSGSCAPNVITLVASANDRLFGTLSVGVDSRRGLLADQLYRDEIDVYRREGRLVGEFSKLAVDPELGSKEVLASLFHLAYIQLAPILGVTDAFIEVNPRHGPFYRRILGFEQIGVTRTCTRVNAPATLLHLDLSHAAAQIRRFGGTRDAHERSLYPYFFSQREEDGLVQRTVGLPHGDRRRQTMRFGYPVDRIEPRLPRGAAPERRSGRRPENVVN